MDDRRNKVIVGAVLAVAVVGVIVLIAVWQSSPKCELSEQQPTKSDAAKSKAKDGTALVNFAGYLKYELDAAAKEPKKSFMPLGLESVTLSKITDSRLLTIGADCAKIAVTLKKSADGKTYAETTQVDLKLANGSYQTCQISTEMGKITADSGKHYYCPSEKTYDCFVKETGKEILKKIATLVVTNLEFEVDNIDKDKFSKGEFSTPQQTCQ